MNEFMRMARIAESMREQYPNGTRVECIYCGDPYRPIASGEKGTIDHIDDMATAHIKWDNGRYFGLAYGEDSFKKIVE